MSSKLHRGMLIFLVALFLITTIGVSVFGFLEATNDDTANVKTKTSVAASCQFDNASAQPLPAPEIYKTPGSVTELQTVDLQKGTGNTVKAGDCLVVKYYGTLATTGVLFDQNYTDDTAIVFPIGIGQVIPGWDAGLIGMQVGGIRRLVIPASLAYKDQSVGSIPPNSDLVFVAKLEAIKQ